jgi:flagellar hook-length control protein FliK
MGEKSTQNVDRVTMATDGQVRPTEAKPASEAGAKENNRSEIAESVLRQVADRIELLAAAKPRNGVTVRLEPEEFGTITLIVRAHGNAVDAEVFAANDEVRKALDASRALLGSSLQARGITLQTLTVDTQAATFQAPADQSARQAPTPQPGTAPAFFAAVDSNGSLDLATLRSFARKSDGIDIWT